MTNPLTSTKTLPSQMPFTKMHGLGNDFMVIDATKTPIDFTAEQIQRWSNRYFGIGFDQLLVVESTDSVGIDFRYRIFNADGSEVSQCGNGARCFAKFVRDKGLTDKNEIHVETASGNIVLHVMDNGWVKVNMGAPNFTPSALPMIADAEADRYTLNVEGACYLIGAVSMGNPHAVLQVENVANAPVAKLGEQIESHEKFPERVNVSFVEVVDDTHVKLRVYERGAAETLACGTGACGTMAVLRRIEKVGNAVTVSLPGGDLLIEWDGNTDHPLWMTGPAETVFEAQLPE